MTRLNKYISDSGYCSRREADRLIKLGEVTIDGTLTHHPGTKIEDKEKITIRGKVITPIKKTERLLLIFHKPAGVLTTKKDPQGRETVLGYLEKKLREEIAKKNCLTPQKNKRKNKSRLDQLKLIKKNLSHFIPVGRLDQNTTGLLLLTNHKELSHALTHPSKEIEKDYSIIIHKPDASEKKILDKIKKGIFLEDGFFKPDQVKPKKIQSSQIEIILTIHSGKNRILRRYFTQLGYPILNLKRIRFHGVNLGTMKAGQFTLIDPNKFSELTTSL